MREQWTPGALFSPPHGAGNQAKAVPELLLPSYLCFYLFSFCLCLLPCLLSSPFSSFFLFFFLLSFLVFFSSPSSSLLFQHNSKFKHKNNKLKKRQRYEVGKSWKLFVQPLKPLSVNKYSISNQAPSPPN